MQGLMRKGSWWATVGMFAALLTLIGLGIMAPTTASPPGLMHLQAAELPPQLLEIWVMTPLGMVQVRPEGSIQIDLAARPPAIRGAECLAEPAPEDASKSGLSRWSDLNHQPTQRPILFLPIRGPS
jgi:hypothetical protein